MVYCDGLNKEGVPCPLALQCARHRIWIDRSKQDFMAWAPFKEKLGKLICTYKIEITDGGESTND